MDNASEVISSLHYRRRSVLLCNREARWEHISGLVPDLLKWSISIVVMA